MFLLYPTKQVKINFSKSLPKDTKCKFSEKWTIIINTDTKEDNPTFKILLT